MSDNKYYFKLYYGFERTENEEYFHTFQAVAPNDDVERNDMGQRLREDLDVGEGNFFKWADMDIVLPEPVVEKIKADAVAEYLAEKDVKKIK